MKCPNDDADLVMTERQGIEIDYCPKCRGVWLDRGELDKIIERASAAPAAPSFAAPAQQYSPPPQYERPREGRHDERRYGHKKRKGFLGELFDFD